MQQMIVFITLTSWLVLSSLMSSSFTGGSRHGVFVTVWALLACIPFMLKPLARAERQFRPALTLISHRRTRGWVHLAPWQPTTNLTPEKVGQFWNSVNTSACQALQTHQTVIISSHLLTGIRARRVMAHLEKCGFDVRSRTYSIPFTPASKALMQLEILFRQWRWRTEFRSVWPVLVLKRKSSDAQK
ncbi:hypothetical protein IAE30_07405 [Pantoea sp. S61]|uniref:hypothetical protein n=1 Tax=Pantoea sp. S61 TaxID=2767442 RepID=UPI00190C93F8|nr:hypothetical protein [Pantoea sp. S61]MBK0123569.1 hypothetical protein [Pantoea sp. S61]